MRGARETWAASLSASLAACNWPPPPAAEPGVDTAWRGFHAADGNAVAAAETAFCGLVALQAAAGNPGEPEQPADGPWASPEPWAVRALAAPQLDALDATFLDPAGGPLAALDASEYLFQGATLAIETAAAELGGFQGHLDASVSVTAALARSLHGGACELLLRRRLPEFGALGGEAAMHLWVALADTSHAWELSVRSCGLYLQAEISSLPARQLGAARSRPAVGPNTRHRAAEAGAVAVIVRQVSTVLPCARGSGLNRWAIDRSPHTPQAAPSICHHVAAHPPESVPRTRSSTAGAAADGRSDTRGHHSGAL